MAAEAQTEPGTAAQVPPRRGLGGLLRMILPVICLFETSLVVSLCLKSSHAPHAPADDVQAAAHSTPAVHQPKEIVSTPADAFQPDLRQGETLLRDGNYVEALPHFWPKLPTARAALPDISQIRAAICLEALGMWPEALEAYRGAASKTSNPRWKTAAQVAQARVHLRMNRAAEAKTLLFPVILASGQPDQFDATLLIEARYLLGLAMSVEAFGNQRLPGLDECPIFANTATWTIAHTLAWFTETAAQPAPADAKAAARLPETIEILRHYGQNSEEILLRGTAQAAPCRELVEKIAALGKLQIVWSPQAPARLEERTAHLALDGVPLMDVLHALLNQHGLYWQIGEGALQIATEAETDKETVKTLRANFARQALRQALFAGPDHPLAATACLELGNDEAMSGKLDEAVAWYERLLAETSRSPNISAAFYNLGLVQRARQNPKAARKAFYRVVDRDPMHELAPRALVQVGWTFISEGRPLEAIFPLRQAVGMAQSAPADAEAILALGAAFLLNGNALEANAVLSESRMQINREPYKLAAAFLDALARHRAATAAQPSPSEKTKTSLSKTRMEAGDLLAGLLAFQNRPSLGTIGQLLAGQAYKELGMPQEMAKVFEHALPSANGPAAAEMTYLLAEHHWAEGKREPALRLFTSLASSPDGKWARAAKLRLATIALSDGEPQQCLSACAALLHEPDAADQGAVLRLMGTAYEQLGDFAKAAKCFAGELPD